MTRVSTDLLRALLCTMILAGCSSSDAIVPDIVNGVSAEDRALESTGGMSTVREGNRQIIRGTGFRVSDNGFVDVSPAYVGAFNAFSPAKTFEAVGSAVMEVRFVVAGSASPATVRLASSSSP